MCNKYQFNKVKVFLCVVITVQSCRVSLLFTATKLITWYLKPCRPNGLASRRKFWTFNLRLVWPPTCVDLHRLAWTCVDFGRAPIWTQIFYRLYRADFVVVWPLFASPCASSGFANLCWLTLTCESVWPGLKLAKVSLPFDHFNKQSLAHWNKVVYFFQKTTSWVGRPLFPALRWTFSGSLIPPTPKL